MQRLAVPPQQLGSVIVRLVQNRLDLAVELAPESLAALHGPPVVHSVRDDTGPAARDPAVRIMPGMGMQSTRGAIDKGAGVKKRVLGGCRKSLWGLERERELEESSRERVRGATSCPSRSAPP